MSSGKNRKTRLDNLFLISYSHCNMTNKTKTKRRVFIVGPVLSNDPQYWTVCVTTNKHYSYLEIYSYDLYEDIYTYGTLKDAVKLAKKLGAKRPYILGLI